MKALRAILQYDPERGIKTTALQDLEEDQPWSSERFVKQLNIILQIRYFDVTRDAERSEDDDTRDAERRRYVQYVVARLRDRDPKTIKVVTKIFYRALKIPGEEGGVGEQGR